MTWDRDTTKQLIATSSQKLIYMQFCGITGKSLVVCKNRY